MVPPVRPKDARKRRMTNPKTAGGEGPFHRQHYQVNWETGTSDCCSGWGSSVGYLGKLRLKQLMTGGSNGGNDDDYWHLQGQVQVEMMSLKSDVAVLAVCHCLQTTDPADCYALLTYCCCYCCCSRSIEWPLPVSARLCKIRQID